MSSDPFKAHTAAKVRPIASRIRRTFLTSAESAVELRESHGLKVADLSKAQQRAEEQRDLIIRHWHERFDYIARTVASVGGEIIVLMKSGREIHFPVADNPRLARGIPAQLDHIEISPFGLHWPDLDEDLSFRGLLEGNHGQRAKRDESCVVREEPPKSNQ